MKSIPFNNLGKFLVEQCQQIDVNDFVHKANQRLKKEFIQTDLLIDGFKVNLTTSELSNGGFRIWFICSFCNKKVGKLYKHPQNQITACRHCHDLEYRSRRYKGMVEMKI